MEDNSQNFDVSKNLEKKEALLVVKNKFSHFPHYSNLITGF